MAGGPVSSYLFQSGGVESQTTQNISGTIPPFSPSNTRCQDSHSSWKHILKKKRNDKNQVHRWGNILNRKGNVKNSHLLWKHILKRKRKNKIHTFTATVEASSSIGKEIWKNHILLLWKYPRSERKYKKFTFFTVVVETSYSIGKDIIFNRKRNNKIHAFTAVEATSIGKDGLRVGHDRRLRGFGWLTRNTPSQNTAVISYQIVS